MEDRKEEFELSKYYLKEFELFDSENDITFNIVDIDTDNMHIICAVTAQGKCSLKTFDLKFEDEDLYFEYSNGDERATYQTPRKDADIYCHKTLQPNKIYLNDFENLED